MNCPKCDQLMKQQENDPTVNVVGGWFCEACDIFVDDSEIDYSDDLDPR